MVYRAGGVKSPGVRQAPAGITLNELVDEYCGGMVEGHVLYAYLPGGASGGILPASMADIPLDFDTLQPHGCFIGSAAVLVLSDRDRARDAALNMMKCFAHESCGQCTPRRLGTANAARPMGAPTRAGGGLQLAVGGDAVGAKRTRAWAAGGGAGVGRERGCVHAPMSLWRGRRRQRGSTTAIPDASRACAVLPRRFRRVLRSACCSRFDDRCLPVTRECDVGR